MDAALQLLQVQTGLSTTCEWPIVYRVVRERDAMNPSSLEDLAFLSRSEHRAAVLDRLSRGARTRPELRDHLGISQPTLGRILGGFEERGWVSKNGRTYSLTPLGALLAREFSTLLETVETIRTLSEVAHHLPFEQMDFDLSLLREATVTTADSEDVLAHMRRHEALVEQSDHVRTLCSSFSPSAVQAQRDRVVNGDHTGEAIIAGEAIDTLTQREDVGSLLGDLIASDKATFYRYDGTVPVMLSLFDETAGIVPLDDEGMPCGTFIESDTEEIRTWVRETINAYKAETTELTPGDLPA